MAKQGTAQRRKKLAEILVSEGTARVGRLAERLGVSTETIRKDLIFLESEGIVKKAHGGATASGGFVERPFRQKSQQNTAEKIAIAKTAVTMIPENGAVILDSGSTTYEIAKLLTLRGDLTIFTNSIPIMQLLSSSHNRVFIFGGEMRASSLAIVGGWTVDALRLVEADIAFLGTDGFAGREGPCSASFEEVEVKRAMMRSSKCNVLVCDHSKFTRSDMFLYSDFSGIDCMITDKNIPAGELKKLANKTEIRIAEVE